MFYRCLRVVVKIYYAIFYPTKIINKDKFIQGKAIYICNHYAVHDSLIIATNLFKRYFHALVKQEAYEGKIARRFFDRIGIVPVKRGEADLTAYKRVMSILNNDESILIFPEGTRNKNQDQTMGALKQGVVVYSLKTNAPIVPMIYYRAHKKFRRNYLLIGDPINLDEYRNKKITNEIKEGATQKVAEVFAGMRYQVNTYVENKKQH